MQNFTFCEVLGGLYCNSNVKTENYTANLIFMWEPVTTWNNQEFSACFVSIYVIHSSGFPYNSGNKFQLMVLLPDELIFYKRNGF